MSWFQPKSIQTQPLSVQEILNHLELHLKTQPNSCFINNYFDVGLKSWQANMDIRPVFNEYEAVT